MNNPYYRALHFFSIQIEQEKLEEYLNNLPGTYVDENIPNRLYVHKIEQVQKVDVLGSHDGKIHVLVSCTKINA